MPGEQHVLQTLSKVANCWKRSAKGTAEAARAFSFSQLHLNVDFRATHQWASKHVLGCQGLKGPCGDTAGTFACCLGPAALTRLVTALQQHCVQQTGGERGWPKYKPTVATSLNWESSHKSIMEVFTFLYLCIQSDGSSFVFRGSGELLCHPQ